MTTLDGATNQPAPYTQVANAGEFAALWNTLTPPERERMFLQIREDADTASRCFMADHSGLKDELSRAQQRIIELTTVEPEPPRPWNIVLKHDKCESCEEAAEFAIQNALDTGQDSSYWNIIATDTIHNARVNR